MEFGKTLSGRQIIEIFIARYNQPGAPVFDLYGDEVDWIEMPTGRRGGRDDLFAVLRGAREQIGEYRFKAISIVADGDEGVLESDWAGRSKDGGELMEVRVLWFWGFRDGKIVKQHDYSFPMNDAARRAYAAVESERGVGCE